MEPSTVDLESGTHLFDPRAQIANIPKIPSHWVFERQNHSSDHDYFCWYPLAHCLHHLFCVIGLGHASLHDVWRASYPGCPIEVWEHGRDELRERLEHINIVAGLLFTATAAFCTTDPPGNGRILPYTNSGPYCVLLTSIAFSLGGLIVGSAAAFVIHKAKIQWFQETMMGSRSRIWVTMILLSFPFLAAGTSTCTAVAGLLIAASHSELLFVRVACYFLVAPPIMCAFAAGCVLCVRTGALDVLLARVMFRRYGRSL